MSPGAAAADDYEMDPHALRPGTRLGKYTILRRFAVGGMAELYLARADGAAGFEKVFALKRIRPVLASDQEFVDMFLREARISASLDHPNIAQVVDVGQSGIEYFFVMEFVHGESLRKVLKTSAHQAKVSVECGVSIVHAAARALHHAHGASDANGKPLLIVHRDVSPSNVLVSFQGDVKVVDFGIAKALAETRQTTGSAFKGKVGYMSPEQCLGEPVDRRSDVFGLGILLYEATTGRRLFTAESQFAVMNKITTGRFEPPSSVAQDYPADLEAMVMRALSVDPNDRHDSAEDFQVELEEVAKANALGMSPRILETAMRELFGERPPPTAKLPEGVTAQEHESTVAPTGRESSATTIDTPPSRRSYAVPVTAALGVVGVAAVAWFAQPGEVPDPATAVETAPVTAPPAGPPESDLTARSTSQPSPLEPASPVEPVAEPAAEPPEDLAAPRHRRTRKPRKPSRSRKTKPKSGEAKSLFPDGL